MPDRTELEWTYEPADLFDVPYERVEATWHLLVDRGRVRATLVAPQAQVDSALEERIAQQVQRILLARQLQVHRAYRLQGPSIWQQQGDKRHVSVPAKPAFAVWVIPRADTVVKDRNGAVVRDTKAERIAGETRTLDLFAAEAAQDETVRAVVESYSRSVSDPDDELVHLYEVRDALSTRYRSEAAAREALGIPRAEWQRLGAIANAEAIDQGRHRGKHPGGRRSATDAELAEVRDMVRRWITAFARTVGGDSAGFSACTRRPPT